MIWPFFTNTDRGVPKMAVMSTSSPVSSRLLCWVQLPMGTNSSSKLMPYFSSVMALMASCTSGVSVMS